MPYICYDECEKEIPMSTASTNAARLDFRLPKAQKSLIERAAALLGCTLTDYSVMRLVERAKEDIQEHEKTVLSDRDRAIFLEILRGDDEPNEAMKRAAARYKARRA